MSYFPRIASQLYGEGVALSDLAQTHGTPLYVYSKKAISDAFMAYKNALGKHEGLICYAVKANSNLAVLGLLAELGAGFDIVSGGELQRVITAGGSPNNVVFSGVGKSHQEIQFALEVGVKCFNVESSPELERISAIATSMGKTANISLRVNPDVDAQTHPYISTGLKENKFGIDIKTAPQVYEFAQSLPNLNITGVDCHIGSQLTDMTPFLDALDRVLALVDTLEAKGITIDHVDIGGGLGVTYRDEQPPAVHDYMVEVLKKLEGRNVSLMMEPGRSIVANAGILLTTVEYLKPTEHKNFAIVDAAMNDNIRPALYQAWVNVENIGPSDATAQSWDIVGPVCETGDFLAHDRSLSLSAGDVLALRSCGAYGFTMSSNYNSRTRAAEIIVDGDQAHLVRERESFDDLIKGEALLPKSNQ
ncbi:diaminopimelate decarboxylase [Marinibactrum halimedae]|uniref:Diaminopimelate decarboxylase n=1 Tax=Marinibactrum halimedae TaxID=1444977 RepID=A0AA37WN81_9GAMM|nr:diaminopimelate decarboxylase [Marinibactrum halimedae]MCD9458293.1 diaminopimelate decarboxylase [Marinibactrum halimedae]GLS27080.1 diaminopimelate decarboxylase [Marinibactrum halimedae]